MGVFAICMLTQSDLALVEYIEKIDQHIMEFKQIVHEEEFDKTVMKAVQKYSVLNTQSTYFGPGRYLLPAFYTNCVNDVKNMEIKSDDLWIQGAPRCGTHWTTLMTWLIKNDLNYELEKQIEFKIRVPTIERYCTCNYVGSPGFSNEDWKNVVDYLSQHSPRFIKTHFPLSMLPDDILDKGKVVHVIRDPRDAAISLYKLKISMKPAGTDLGTFKEFWTCYIEDKIQLTAFFLLVKEAWAKRSHPNLIIIFYEEMVQDLPSVVRRVAKFLNKQYTDEQISTLCNHLNFDSVKNYKDITEEFNKIAFNIKKDDTDQKHNVKKDDIFFRKGKIGGWREHFDEEMRQQAKRWMLENIDSIGMEVPASWREWD